MASVETSIEIETSSARVWQALADLGRYGAWNPFIVRADGILGVGEHLDLTVRLEDDAVSMRRFSPLVLEARPGQGMVLLVLPATLASAGEHVAADLYDMIIEPTGTNGVRLTQRFASPGKSAPLCMDQSALIHGLEMMNRAVRARVEASPVAHVGLPSRREVTSVAPTGGRLASSYQWHAGPSLTGERRPDMPSRRPCTEA